jgi:hypothetical protein
MTGVGALSETTSLYDAAGVLVIRVWREPDHPRTLRARITAVRDVADGDVETAAASSVEQVVEFTERFLVSFTTS